MEDNKVNKVGSMENSNPIAASLAAQASVATQQPEAQQVTPETETQQQTQEPAAQTEQVEETNIESTSQEQIDESQSAEEATALENVEDNNASQDQDGGNTEDETASQTETSWFDDEEGGAFDETVVPESLPEGDYSSLGNALGLENATGEQVIGRITEMTSENQALTEKVKSLEENSNYATPELAAANEVARNGGDYLTLLGLSQNNWDAVPDDVLLVEGRLKDAFPNDEEGMHSYLNGMDKVQKQLMAKDIRDGLKANDEFQQQEIVRKSAERRQKIDQGIRKTLDSTDELFGLKLNPSMKKGLYDKLTTGDFIKDIFHGADGQPDPAKLVRAAVALGNLNKIVKTAMTKSSNDATGKILDEVSSPNVTKQGQMVDPKPKKQASPMDSHMAHLQQQGPR